MSGNLLELLYSNKMYTLKDFHTSEDMLSFKEKRLLYVVAGNRLAKLWDANLLPCNFNKLNIRNSFSAQK